MLRNITVTVAFILLILSVGKAQQTTPQLLKEPAGWAFERFALPPQFAPSFPYKGVEELRFSPGMFVKDSISYFTYAFVGQLDSITIISQSEIKDYLLEYFKGLCSSTANQRKLIIDTSKIHVEIENNKVKSDKEIFYNVIVNTYGVFTDGAPVTLNMEIKVLHDDGAKKIYLLFIVSPQKKTDAVWKELFKIQANFIIPAAKNKS